MFEDLLRELKVLEAAITVSVPIEADERGYIDKECPASECLFRFKVHEEDWKNLFQDEAVFCPQCRHEAPAKSWFTAEQVEHAQEVGYSQLRSRVDGALRRSARRFNARMPRKSFFRMSLDVKGSPPIVLTGPALAAATMEQEVRCSGCAARFAVVGIAYFCPCCGLNSVERTYEVSLKKISELVDNLSEVRVALEQAGRKDAAAAACAHILESSLQDCVTAFQLLGERLYRELPNARPLSKNAFQRLGQGADLWREAVGRGYEAWLNEAELLRLRVLFQRRHLLAHRSGLVDQEYVDKSDDTTYAVGQRLVVSSADVHDLVRLLSRLGTELIISRNAAQIDLAANAI